MATYYKRIKELREEQELPQRAVAGLLHVTQKTYSRYELGQHEVPITALIQMARMYDTSVDYIVELTDQRSPYPLAAEHHNDPTIL
ncbi:MAG: helix-turn-helix transcriptional regulator [Eubacterium sp.]|nr:helix-turn-helix transcriptional regulator [Eubacterium sp.]